MKNTVKIFLFPVMILLSILLLSSCVAYSDPDYITLKNETLIREYAAEHFPPSTFIRMEIRPKQNICFFTDDACGFEFSVSSNYFPRFDGITDTYYEETFNSWDQSYYDYVMNKIREPADGIASKYGFVIEKQNKPHRIAFACLDTDHTLEQISEGMKQLGNLVRQEDVYHKYDDCELWAMHCAEEGIWQEFAYYRFRDEVTGYYENQAR